MTKKDNQCSMHIRLGGSAQAEPAKKTRSHKKSRSRTQRQMENNHAEHGKTTTPFQPPPPITFLHPILLYIISCSLSLSTRESVIRPTLWHHKFSPPCHCVERFLREVLPVEGGCVNHRHNPQSEEHDDGAAAGHLPVNRGTQPFRQAPPPHPMMALTLRMAMLARRPLSGPLTPPTGPTRHQTMMEEMGEFSPIPPWLVK